MWCLQGWPLFIDSAEGLVSYSTSGLLTHAAWTLTVSFSFACQKSLMRLSRLSMTVIFSVTATFKEEVVTLLKLSGVCQSQLLDGKPGLEAVGDVRQGNFFTWKVSSSYKIMLKKKLISALRSAILQMSCKNEIHTQLLMIPVMGLEYLSAISQYLHLILVVHPHFCLSRMCFLCIYANFMH